MRAHYDCKLLDCKIRLLLSFDDSRRCNIRCFPWRGIHYFRPVFQCMMGICFHKAHSLFQNTDFLRTRMETWVSSSAWRSLPSWTVGSRQRGRRTAWGRCILWGRACSDPGRWRGRCSYSTSHSSQDQEWWTSGCLGKISPKPLKNKNKHFKA